MNTHQKNDNQEFESRMKALLDEALEQSKTRPEINQQLKRARARAMGLQRKRRPFPAPALGWALAVGIVAVVLLPRLQAPPESLPVEVTEISSDDVELINTMEDFEQDLAFYYWLESHDAAPG